MAGPLTYRATYENLVLAGAMTSGEPIGIVAGKHGEGFPYFGQPAWDSVLVAMGTSGWAASGALSTLSITTDASMQTLELAYRDATIALELQADLVPFEPEHLIQPYGGERGPGMLWHPFFLKVRQGRVILTEGGERCHDIRHAVGQLETGALENFRSPRLAFIYDYDCYAHADLVTPAASYAYVRFVAHALRSGGAIGRLLEEWLERSASRELTLGDDPLRPARGNLHGVLGPSSQDHEATIVADVIDLRLATLERRLVRARDRSGHTLLGLREIFTPKPKADASCA